MSNLSDNINDKISKNEFFYSIEIFPSKNEDELNTIYKELELFLKEYKNPLFIDVTYHSHSQRPIEHPCSSLSIATHLIQNFKNLHTVLHLTCVNTSLPEINSLLERAKVLNIRNLFVLRGDKISPNSTEQAFNYANELVSYIRERYDFTICVAAYPGKHPESKSIEDDIKYLEQKVDSGANYILTQIIFDSDQFIEFVQKCRDANIKIAIIPGILPVYSLESVDRIEKFCRVNVSKELVEFLEQNQDEQRRIDFCINYFVNLCKKIIASKSTSGLHFYTMNNFEIVKSILSKI